MSELIQKTTGHFAENSSKYKMVGMILLSAILSGVAGMAIGKYTCENKRETETPANEVK